MSDAIRSYARNSAFKILSPEQEKKIHESCLQVLEQTGVSTTNKKLLRVMADHGQKVDFDEMRIRFDPDFVEQQRKKAPRNYTLHARNPEYDLPLDGERGWLSTDGCPAHVWDIDTLQRRYSAKEPTSPGSRRSPTRSPRSRSNGSAAPPTTSRSWCGRCTRRTRNGTRRASTSCR
jgi:trimethylamine:corrinoid methyltransferase-like protein